MKRRARTFDEYFLIIFPFLFLICSLTGQGDLSSNEKKSLFYTDDGSGSTNNYNAREVFRQYIQAVSPTAIFFSEI
jgi:hypothetical protein